MGRFIVGGILCMIVAMGGTVCQAAGLTKIADNIYSYVAVKHGSPANSFAANAGIVIGRDGIVVIDTLISAKEARRFIGDIRKISNKPIKYVINTHHHLDHTFGNGEFAKRGAVIISQTECRNAMVTTSEETLKNAKGYGLTPVQMAGTTIAYPTITFTDRMTVDLGGQELELIYFGPSHTRGSILVHVPGKNVVFAGDILFTDFHPYLAEGDIVGWANNLDRLAAFGVETIIPGHGPVSGNKDVQDMKAYLLTFDAKARELALKGGDVESAATALKAALPGRADAEWMIPFNLKTKYFSGK